MNKKSIVSTLVSNVNSKELVGVIISKNEMLFQWKDSNEVFKRPLIRPSKERLIKFPKEVLLSMLNMAGEENVVSTGVVKYTSVNEHQILEVEQTKYCSNDTGENWVIDSK
jgi:hypothetical protein